MLLGLKGPFFWSPAFSRGLELGDPKSDRCGDTGHFHVTECQCGGGQCQVGSHGKGRVQKRRLRGYTAFISR